MRSTPAHEKMIEKGGSIERIPRACIEHECGTVLNEVRQELGLRPTEFINESAEETRTKTLAFDMSLNSNNSIVSNHLVNHEKRRSRKMR